MFGLVNLHNTVDNEISKWCMRYSQCDNKKTVLKNIPDKSLYDGKNFPVPSDDIETSKIPIRFVLWFHENCKI